MTSQAPPENSDHGSGFKSLGLGVYDVTGVFWLLVNFVVKITACTSEALGVWPIAGKAKPLSTVAHSFAGYYCNPHVEVIGAYKQVGSW